MTREQTLFTVGRLGQLVPVVPLNPDGSVRSADGERYLSVAQAFRRFDMPEDALLITYADFFYDLLNRTPHSFGPVGDRPDEAATNATAGVTLTCGSTSFRIHPLPGRLVRYAGNGKRVMDRDAYVDHVTRTIFVTKYATNAKLGKLFASALAAMTPNGIAA